MKYLITTLSLMMILFLSSCNEKNDTMVDYSDQNTESILLGKGQSNIVGKITSYLNTLNMDKDSKKTVMQLRNDFVHCVNSSEDYCECVLGFYTSIKESNINSDNQTTIMAWLKEQYPDCIPDDKISPCEIMEAVANAYPNNWEFKNNIMSIYNSYASKPCDCENLRQFLSSVNSIFQINIDWYRKNTNEEIIYYPISKQELLDMIAKTDCSEYILSNSNAIRNLLDGVPNRYYEEVGAESTDEDAEEDIEE